MDISNVVLSNASDEGQIRRRISAFPKKGGPEGQIPQINPYAVLRRKYKSQKKVVHESLAVGNLVENSALLQATINAQRKSSLSFSVNTGNIRKVGPKNSEPVVGPRLSEPEEDKSAPQNQVESNSDSGPQERQMLLRYIFAWSDLAAAYQQEGYFAESMDCVESAALIYERLLMYPHMALCLGQFFVARVWKVSQIV